MLEQDEADRWQPIDETLANTILGSIAKLVQVDDEPIAVDVLAAVSRNLGADAAMFASFTLDDASLASYRVLHACDARWASRYAVHQWYLSDPWLHYALYNAEPIWSTDLQGHSEAEREVALAAQEIGFVHNLIVPAPTMAAQSRTAVLCLGSRSAGFFTPRHYPVLRSLARALAMELGDWMQRHLRTELMELARITDGDLELLRHEQLGHSSKVIAAALCTEPKTIDCRFRRLSIRLGAANRRAALRRAEIYGLI